MMPQVLVFLVLHSMSVIKGANFYYDVSGEEAERLLLRYGQKGEFVARPSESQPNNYTLSINRGNSITHVKIQRNGDTLDLLGGESFASLADLVKHYIDNPDQLKERNGETIIIQRPLTLPVEESHARRVRAPDRWFHAGITGKEAVQLLAAERQWTYLVRESQRTPGQFAISVKTGDDTYKHIKIERNPSSGRLHVGGGDEFVSIDELLSHYKKNPMVEEGTQNVVRLSFLLRSTSVPVEALNERLAVLSKKDDASGNKDGFFDEFERLNQVDYQMYSRREGKMPHNVDKNRYKNIVPYDHTRVQLRDSPSNRDYINANYIRMDMTGNGGKGKGSRLYISTQGCLPNTVGDFWRMVFQENVVVIVMTTKENERGRVKCERYWPEKGRVMSADQGEFSIKNRHEEVFREGDDDSFVKRTLLLKRQHDERVITQFQFVGWPDHGCPQNPDCVLSLLEMANKEADKQPLAPLVVHCSAGIGRTGTFIVLDALLHYIQAHGSECKIDVARTVLQIREQREDMVQTEQQYRFIYNALAYYVNTHILNFAAVKCGSSAECNGERQSDGDSPTGEEYTTHQ